jgi:signal recognition particle subunit SRP54
LLDALKERLQGAIRKILGSPAIDERTIREFVMDIQRSLLQADVKVSIVSEVSKRIEKRALEEKPPPGLPRKDHIVKILYEEFSRILGPQVGLSLSPDNLNIILMVGIQGSGKTTSVSKLARFYARKGYKVGVVGADTYRPGALTQLKMNCATIGVEVFGNENEKDAVKVASEGISYFQRLDKNLVIVDTAGRHKEEKDLISEMQQISNKIKPNLVLLTIDGTIGQQSFGQAEAFHRAVPIGGIVITKLDGAAKGGGALAAAAATGATIYFIGTGERVDDLELFSPTRFVGRLLGMGDLQALLDRARELEAEADEKQIKRIMSGKLTMNDFLFQIEQVRKMGSMKKILEALPGLSQAGIKKENLEEIEARMKYWRVIIQSMTKEEKQDPDVLNSSRIRRVARGSGTTEKDVKDLLQRYRQTKGLMKQSKDRQFRQILKQMGRVHGPN